MSSNFPNSIDTFINPIYTKVNGVDYVKAEHVNDLQDAVRNIEIVLAGSGIGIGLSSNNYIPANSSVKNALQIIDGVIKLRQTAFENHTSFAMPTDPFQHHGNVIQVTSIGNLSSTRLQQALEELQNDIDNLMSGGYVEGETLDSRYILKGGPAIVQGELEAEGNASFLQNVSIGSSLSHLLSIAGSSSIGGSLALAQDLSVGGVITIPNTGKICAQGYPEYTSIGLDASGINFKSLKDFVFVIDSDDSIDAISELRQFKIQDSIGNSLFSINENGICAISNKLGLINAEVASYIDIGTTNVSRLEENKLTVSNSSFSILLDADNNQAVSDFTVTKDGDFGTLDTSTGIILKAKESSVIAGSHVLKRGVQEVGYFGMKFYSDNAGGKFNGVGVNFKTKMINTPSSVTLSIDPTKSSNYNNVTITDINEYGFFVQCDSLTIGSVEIKGTYTTVGN